MTLSLFTLCMRACCLLSPNGPTDRPFVTMAGKAHYVSKLNDDGSWQQFWFIGPMDRRGILPADATTDCSLWDLDGDGDVDLRDFAELQNGR